MKRVHPMVHAFKPGDVVTVYIGQPLAECPLLKGAPPHSEVPLLG